MRKSARNIAESLGNHEFGVAISNTDYKYHDQMVTDIELVWKSNPTLTHAWGPDPRSLGQHLYMFNLDETMRRIRDITIAGDISPSILRSVRVIVVYQISCA